MPQFAHLHCHTQFSLLDGAASIPKMFAKAKADGMKAIAITDHGNMFGVFDFVAQAGKLGNEVKPIVGCEFYVVEDRHKRQFTKDLKDKRFHQLFLAKNPIGYANLSKLCSLGYIEGMYGKYPRIDKELILKYHEGLIATTCCIGARVPQMILKEGEDAARKEFKWWLDIFGEDYYIELQRHNMVEQEKVNEVLLKFAQEFNVKIIASNDSHYVNQDDSYAHDILLCINTGEKISTPSNKDFTDDDSSQKGKRFAFPNDQFYFKTTQEMSTLFHDLPQAIDNTMEIVDKVEILKLEQDILLPHFQIPKEYQDQDEFLKHLAYLGAKERYKDITPDVEERLNFELHTIRTMGFAGYFLIVADFIKAGKELGVFIGPGRGSAAGSVVAYTLGITNIDPLKYKLLFERFLNPDRKSMPDIDTDFDDDGRQKVINYVIEKYGKEQVAQIVTYGTMAAKMSIKDVARTLDLPLSQANDLVKLVPNKAGIKLHRVFDAPLTGDNSLEAVEELRAEDIDNIKKIRTIYNDKSTLESEVITQALKLEGSVRGTGVHAAGIIIAPKPLYEIMPVCTAKDTDMLLTQFEGNVVESAGVLKMDFLGLKTLSIMKTCLSLIKQNHNVDIELDELPLDDLLTYELYQRGDTNGTFQFESPGMQKYLKDLKPNKFEDLIAMNALYRPGPIQYIPTFINRKLGHEPITYDLDVMQEILEETYGVTVYQEQVMLLSQKLANFSKGDADTLRKAMGKKQREVLNKMKSKFMDGCAANGYSLETCEKIWTDWEAFAQYAFNKSHSTGYALLAYQTAYLKANYTAEYMASVLTHNDSDIDKVRFFMDECRKMGVSVKGPDVNESQLTFSVNKKGDIRYALKAVKGVGEAAVESLIEERTANGSYKDLFDFFERINLRTVNKKVVESLVYAGAFDSLSDKRSLFFHSTDRYPSFIEYMLRYGNAFQSESSQSQNSLFGESKQVMTPKPEIPTIEEWPLIQKLNFEKDVVGIFISGHPLDDYRFEVRNVGSCQLIDLPNRLGGKNRLAVFVASANHRISKKGSGFGEFSIQDFSGDFTFSLFGEDYQRYKALLEPGNSILIEATYSKQMNWRQEEELRFKIQEIRALESVSENYISNITVQVQVHAIDSKLIERLHTVCKNHKGKQRFSMILNDHQNRTNIQFKSKNNVKIDETFTYEMERLGLSYSIK